VTTIVTILNSQGSHQVEVTVWDESQEKDNDWVHPVRVDSVILVTGETCSYALYGNRKITINEFDDKDFAI